MTSPLPFNSNSETSGFRTDSASFSLLLLPPLTFSHTTTLFLFPLSLVYPHQSGGSTTLEALRKRKRERERLLCVPLVITRRRKHQLSNLESTVRSAERSRPTTSKTEGKMRTTSSSIPSEEEIEEFFSAAETKETTQFAAKYNYDVAKDAPLEGRYEWVRLEH